MSTFTLKPEDFKIYNEDHLSAYDFGTKVAKHYFCNRCGIYTFHQTKLRPGYYRVNLGCIKGINSTKLPYTIYDGAST